jgi:hypothetical protein
MHLRFELQRHLRERGGGALLGRDARVRRMLTRRAPSLLALVAAAALAGASADAHAQSTIRTPGDRAPTAVELEPHLDLGAFDPPGYGTGFGYGLGARGGFEIVHDGFVPSINDSVAIGVGVDFLHYDGSGNLGAGSRCLEYVPGPAGTMVCRKAATPGGASNYLFFPVVMQWNFWLTRGWSVFGEPGLAIYWVDSSSVGVTPAFWAGGRYRFTDNVALVFRLGYPTLTVGLSFLF